MMIFRENTIGLMVRTYIKKVGTHDKTLANSPYLQLVRDV